MQSRAPLAWGFSSGSHFSTIHPPRLNLSLSLTENNAFLLKASTEDQSKIISLLQPRAMREGRPDQSF